MSNINNDAFKLTNQILYKVVDALPETAIGDILHNDELSSAILTLVYGYTPAPVSDEGSTCHDCKFYHEFTNEKGLCRRYPPTLVKLNEGRIEEMTPAVSSDSSLCGEFIRRNE